MDNYKILTNEQVSNLATQLAKNITEFIDNTDGHSDPFSGLKDSLTYSDYARVRTYASVLIAEQKLTPTQVDAVIRCLERGF